MEESDIFFKLEVKLENLLSWIWSDTYHDNINFEYSPETVKFALEFQHYVYKQKNIIEKYAENLDGRCKKSPYVTKHITHLYEMVVKFYNETSKILLTHNRTYYDVYKNCQNSVDIQMDERIGSKDPFIMVWESTQYLKRIIEESTTSISQAYHDEDNSIRDEIESTANKKKNRPIKVQPKLLDLIKCDSTKKEEIIKIIQELKCKNDIGLIIIYMEDKGYISIGSRKRNILLRAVLDETDGVNITPQALGHYFDEAYRDNLLEDAKKIFTF